MATGSLLVTEVLLSARYSGATDACAPAYPGLLPLSGDEIYMFGLPWDPWLAYAVPARQATPGQLALALPSLPTIISRILARLRR